MIDEENLLIHEDQLESQSKVNFYKLLAENGIDFETIESSSRLPEFMVKVIKNDPTEYNKFNNVIYQLNKKKLISIVDAMTFLVEDWVEPQILLKCLDEMNYYTLMNGLKDKHNLSGNMSADNDFFV